MKPQFQCWRQPTSGVPCSAMGMPASPWTSKACCTARICRLRARAQVSLKVLYFQSYNKKEEMLCPSKSMMLLSSKNQHCLRLAQNCTFMGKQIPLGQLEGQDYPQLLQTHSTKQELQVQSILCFPSAEDSCSAIPTTMGLPGAVPVPGGSIHPYEGRPPSATGRNRHKWTPEL